MSCCVLFFAKSKLLIVINWFRAWVKEKKKPMIVPWETAKNVEFNSVVLGIASIFL